MARSPFVCELFVRGEDAHDKDRDDVRNILALRASDLDWMYLRRWVQLHGASTLLEEIQASLRTAN